MLSTVDLLALIILDQLLLYFKYYLPFLQNKVLYQEVNCTEFLSVMLELTKVFGLQKEI
jgi:hypothetical protein